MTQHQETFRQFMSGAARGRPLTNSIGRKAMTRTRLQSLIAQGFGQGRGENYIPLIRVTRGNAPRRSNHVTAVTNILARPVHLLSRMELQALRLAVWLGAVEVREQFPLWPWAQSPHPMAGLDPARDKTLPPTRGLLEIAAEAGIEHGTWVGAKDLPYVATTDLVICLGLPPSDRLVFWSCKPACVLADAKLGPRARQRIELERRYAAAIGAHHTVYDGTHAPGALLDNLDWLEPTRSELRDPGLTEGREAFARSFNDAPEHASIEQRIQTAAEREGLALPAAQRHFRAAAWRGLIDADLSQPVVMSRPLKAGGAQLKRRLFHQLMGGES